LHSEQLYYNISILQSPNVIKLRMVKQLWYHHEL